MLQHNSKTLVGVLGQPRSGTSLVCQMLAATGFDVAGEWPAYEVEADPNWIFRREWLKTDTPQAVKILEPQDWHPPFGFRWKFILTKRNYYEQAKSLGKLGGERYGPEQLRKLAGHLKRDHSRTFQLLLEYEAELLILPFERLIKQPKRSAERMARFLDGTGVDIDRKAMAACVRKRSTACYPGFLELELLEQGQ